MVNLYYYSSLVRKNLSSKFDEFLVMQSQFDSDHGVDLYAYTRCLSATFGPLFAFYCPLSFTREKKQCRISSDVYAAVFALDVATALRQIDR